MIRVVLSGPEGQNAFEVSRDVAERMQAFYNMDQFVKACTLECEQVGWRGPGVFCPGIRLDLTGDVDAITDFLDDLAIEIARLD